MLTINEWTSSKIDDYHYYLQEEQREEVKEWVLAVSMDQRVEQTLSLDERNTFEGSLTTINSDDVCLPCVVTGMYELF